MASTGVPPTGRSRAFANRFSGFHRAKTLIGGSSLTGVSVATGVRRSRTRIDPCFRAARTHAPVRRCSSLIEISFMCHIVTHCWSHRQAIARRSRNAPSRLLGRPTGEVTLAGRCFGASRYEVATGRTGGVHSGRVAQMAGPEGKQAAHWTRLSCHRFRANEVRLQLSVLAYNLGNLWRRRLVLPARIDSWSLTSLQQRLVKTGGRLVKHARYYWLLLAESHLTRRLFGSMLERIWALPVPTG